MTFIGPQMSCLTSGVALLGHGVSTYLPKYKVLVVANVHRDILRSNPYFLHQTPPLLFNLFHSFCKTSFISFKHPTLLHELVSQKLLSGELSTSATLVTAFSLYLCIQSFAISLALSSSLVASPTSVDVLR